MSASDIDLDHLEPFLEDRMRVYLAGPLTGVSPDQSATCRAIRLAARQILRTRFTVFDPADCTPPSTQHSADQVFIEDHTRTSTSDLVFFHVNAPSLGVGIESQIAAEATIPRVVALPKGAQISRMFDGVFNPTIARIEYLTPKDFETQLISLLPEIYKYARASREKRRPVQQAISSARIGRDIFKSRVLLKMNLEDLAKQTDIRSCMLKRLERDDGVAPTLTLAQLMRIANELKATIVMGAKTVPSIQGPADEPQIHEHHARSLDSLYEFLKSRHEVWVSDQRVFSMWDYAFPTGLLGPVAARGDDPSIARKHVLVEEWRTIQDELQRRESDPGLFG